MAGSMTLENAMKARRFGFSIIELLFVLIIVGVVTVIAAPGGRKIMERNAMRNAKQEIAATLAVARATAIHNGRPVRFIRNGNQVHSRIESGAQLKAIGAIVDVMADHKVQLVTSRDTLRFDARGMATGMPGSHQSIHLRRGQLLDSVCVTRFGRIVAEGACP